MMTVHKKAVFLASGAIILLLAGCVSTPKAGPAASASSSVAIPGLPAGVVPAAIPTDVPNSVEARSSVAMTSCEAAPGGWAAAGTVTNSGKTAVDYTITVFFTTTKATVIDSAQTKVSVDPGSKKSWTATKKFGAASQMLCVLRGVG
jgi:hypothetical protein